VSGFQALCGLTVPHSGASWQSGRSYCICYCMSPACVVHSLFEEYYWRWFVFGRLRSISCLGWRSPLPALASCCINRHPERVLPRPVLAAGAAFSVCVGIGGAMWAFLYERAGSLLAPGCVTRSSTRRSWSWGMRCCGRSGWGREVVQDWEGDDVSPFRVFLFSSAAVSASEKQKRRLKRALQRFGVRPLYAALWSRLWRDSLQSGR